MVSCFATWAGRKIRPAPKPEMMLKVKTSIGTLGLRTERQRPIDITMLPVMQMGRNPNSLTNPPTIGPDIDIVPKNSDPTQDTVEGSES